MGIIAGFKPLGDVKDVPGIKNPDFVDKFVLWRNAVVAITLILWGFNLTVSANKLRETFAARKTMMAGLPRDLQDNAKYFIAALTAADMIIILGFMAGFGYCWKAWVMRKKYPESRKLMLFAWLVIFITPFMLYLLVPFAIFFRKDLLWADVCTLTLKSVVMDPVSGMALSKAALENNELELAKMFAVMAKDSAAYDGWCRANFKIWDQKVFGSTIVRFSDPQIFKGARMMPLVAGGYIGILPTAAAGANGGGLAATTYVEMCAARHDAKHAQETEEENNANRQAAVQAGAQARAGSFVSGFPAAFSGVSRDVPSAALDRERYYSSLLRTEHFHPNDNTFQPELSFASAANAEKLEDVARTLNAPVRSRGAALSRVLGRTEGTEGGAGSAGVLGALSLDDAEKSAAERAAWVDALAKEARAAHARGDFGVVEPGSVGGELLAQLAAEQHEAPSVDSVGHAFGFEPTAQKVVQLFADAHKKAAESERNDGSATKSAKEGATQSAPRDAPDPAGGAESETPSLVQLGRIRAHEQKDTPGTSAFSEQGKIPKLPSFDVCLPFDGLVTMARFAKLSYHTASRLPQTITVSQCLSTLLPGVFSIITGVVRGTTNTKSAFRKASLPGYLLIAAIVVVMPAFIFVWATINQLVGHPLFTIGVSGLVIQKSLFSIMGWHFVTTSKLDKLDAKVKKVKNWQKGCMAFAGLGFSSFFVYVYVCALNGDITANFGIIQNMIESGEIWALIAPGNLAITLCRYFQIRLLTTCVATDAMVGACFDVADDNIVGTGKVARDSIKRWNKFIKAKEKKKEDNPYGKCQVCESELEKWIPGLNCPGGDLQIGADGKVIIKKTDEQLALEAAAADDDADRAAATRDRALYGSVGDAMEDADMWKGFDESSADEDGDGAKKKKKGKKGKKSKKEKEKEKEKEKKEKKKKKEAAEAEKELDDLDRLLAEAAGPSGPKEKTGTDEAKKDSTPGDKKEGPTGDPPLL